MTFHAHNISRAIEALENGAQTIDGLRREVELLNARLEMVHILHQITNPSRGSQVMGRVGYGHPDASSIMRTVVIDLRKDAAQIDEVSDDAKKL